MSALIVLRILLIETTETSLVCAACGGFRTEYAIEPTGDMRGTRQVGVHKRCIENLAVPEHTK